MYQQCWFQHNQTWSQLSLARDLSEIIPSGVHLSEVLCCLDPPITEQQRCFEERSYYRIEQSLRKARP